MSTETIHQIIVAGQPDSNNDTTEEIPFEWEAGFDLKEDNNEET
jgi:hypothetical protein